MRLLVTGGAGFIGRRVVTAALAAGHEVRVVDALLPGSHPAGATVSVPAGAEFIHGDLRDEGTVARVLRGVDVVSHQAAVVGRGREILDARHHVGCNDMGTATLLAAMTEAGISRLVLASSVVIYGASNYDCPAHGRVRPAGRAEADLAAGRYAPVCPACGAELAAVAVTEDDVPNPPRNVYAVTKLAQELLCDAWATQTGGTATALRYHNVYGPDMSFASPYSGVTATFRSAVLAGVAPEVYEDGAPTRDFIHVDDIVAANMAALDRTGPGLRPFNIASGTPLSILSVASILAGIAGGPPPVVTGRFRVGDVRDIVASPDRAIRELDWRPRVHPDAGLKEFAEAPMRGGPGTKEAS